MDSIEAIRYFEKLNRLRIERVADLATVQQQNFLSLLAFLFHTNIEGLPGFVDKNTPAGIIDFQAEKACLKVAQKLFPSVKYRQRPLRHYPITGLYLVNSQGMFKLSEQAPFCLYLVCSPRLNDDQRQRLEQKLTAMAEWALTQGIVLTSQLLSDDKLISEQGEPVLSSEQLDQFYLNGLVMAGALPFWWLVPPDADYENTVQSITQQRIQTTYQLLDFGQPQKVDPNALLAQLTATLAEKMESGLDGILELVYLQQRLLTFPQNQWLSQQYKQRAYQKEYEPLYLDEKVFKLFDITASELSEEIKHLAIQSFYLHTEEALSKRAPNPRFPWRRRFVSELSQDWQWEPYQYQVLDQRNEAQYRQCLEEHEQTKQLFLDINTSIQQFCQQHAFSGTQLNRYITKRLQQVNDTVTNIIPVLPQGLLAKNPDEHLYLYRFGTGKDWKLSVIPLSDEEQKPMYQHSSLLNVLSWGMANRTLSNATRVMIADKTNVVTITNVISLTQYLRKSGLVNPIINDNKALLAPASLSQVFLLANFDQTAKNRTHQNAVQLSSLHNDPFNYANRGETLLSSIDLLIQSNHGQWQTFRFTGDTSPLEMLRQLMPWWTNTSSPSKAYCWCPSENYGQLISTRIEEIYKEVCTHFYRYDTANYIIKIADTFFQLLWQPGLTDLIKLPAISDMHRHLSKSNQDVSATKLDSALDPSGLFNELLNYQSLSHITLFFVMAKSSASIYILDNRYVLLSQHNIKLSETTLLTHYYRFLTTIKPEQVALRCITLHQDQNKSWQSKTVSLNTTLSKQNYLPVTVEMTENSINADCTITCGPKQFTGSANDPKLFQQVSDFLLKLRNTASKYPLYITGLTFLDTLPVTTADYINQKQRLEKLLNTD